MSSAKFIFKKVWKKIKKKTAEIMLCLSVDGQVQVYIHMYVYAFWGLLLYFGAMALTHHNNNHRFIIIGIIVNDDDDDILIIMTLTPLVG